VKTGRTEIKRKIQDMIIRKYESEDGDVATGFTISCIFISNNV
jgi:hypothetical protein